MLSGRVEMYFHPAVSRSSGNSRINAMASS